MRVAFALQQNAILVGAMIVLLRSTLVPFFLGECRVRYRSGFRETEVVVRRTPPCIKVEKLLLRECKASSKDDQPGSRLRNFWQCMQRIVDPQTLYYRPSALLSTEHWIMDYATLLNETIDKGKLFVDDLDFEVWRRQGDCWLAIYLWKMQHIMS